jgi:hypothetical protein
VRIATPEALTAVSGVLPWFGLPRSLPNR